MRDLKSCAAGATRTHAATMPTNRMPVPMIRVQMITFAIGSRTPTFQFYSAVSIFSDYVSPGALPFLVFRRNLSCSEAAVNIEVPEGRLLVWIVLVGRDEFGLATLFVLLPVLQSHVQQPAPSECGRIVGTS